jgi:hypothetical protein
MTKSRALMFQVGDRYYFMSEPMIAQFLARIRAVGMWEELIGCDTCGVVCIDSAFCKCEGHASRRKELGMHRSVAKVRDVIRTVRGDFEPTQAERKTCK